MLHRPCPQFQHLDGFLQAHPEISVTNVEGGHFDDPQELPVAILPSIDGCLFIGVEFAGILADPAGPFQIPIRSATEMKQTAQRIDCPAGCDDRPCTPLSIENRVAGRAAGCRRAG